MDFEECALGYFDSKKVLARFNRAAGFNVTGKHRPRIERTGATGWQRLRPWPDRSLSGTR
jgi:hypothetical protein